MSPGEAPRGRGRQHQSHQHHQHRSLGQLELIIKIGLLPDAIPDALESGFQCVRTHLIQGFMAFHTVRDGRIVMLMVSAWPESGFLERAARPPTAIG